MESKTRTFTIWTRQVLVWHETYLTNAKGFNIGIRGKNAFVVCNADERQVYEAEQGRTEWVTIVECICGDGSAIPPLTIFKGENIQTGWIPLKADDNRDWAWSKNSKGWTCDIIAIDWIKRVFDPATREKANGEWRLLICDGHGSHVSAEFVGYCMENKIQMLLMPPHSSHLCQPLDVGVFSPLKIHMSTELSRITRYGINNVKKFEWADAYRIARPKAMTTANITSAFRAAGLIPLNRHKVLARMGEPNDNSSDLENELPAPSPTPPPPPPPPPHPFNLVPNTPSRMNAATVLHASKVLITNIEARILDTPTRTFIPKLVSFAEYNCAQLTVANHENQAKENILKKRREVATGKRVVLKDQHIITTREIHAQLEECEKATRARKNSRARGRRKSAPGALESVANEGGRPNEAGSNGIGLVE